MSLLLNIEVPGETCMQNSNWLPCRRGVGSVRLGAYGGESLISDALRNPKPVLYCADSGDIVFAL